MKRLTARNSKGEAYYPECFNENGCHGNGFRDKCNYCQFAKKAKESLTAYEETGLTPEQIRGMDEIFQQQAKELMQLKGEKERGKTIDDIQEALSVAILILEEIRGYRQIGSIGECLKYKMHSEQISEMHSCNDCAKNTRCEIMPKLGSDCRINCHLWEKLPGKEL